MHVHSTLIPALGLFAHLGTAAYTLKDDYLGGNPESFFEKFDFFTDPDPTNGHVKYVDRSTAKSSGLIGVKDGSVYVGVDHQNKAPDGRPSVRLASTQTYNHGLVILDLDHMPGSICGTWPAFWMLGADWPINGEIDIIEGVNQQSSNQITLHTNAGCSIDSIDNSSFTGSLTTSNCDVKAPGQIENAGCSIDNQNDQSYGSGFNQANGGIYATEWTSESINVWHFPRARVPPDIHGKSPNPSSWGKPTAKFAGTCKIDSHFKNLQIVFDVTFCGDWGDGDWAAGCSSKASTCKDYVSNNPNAFEDSHWRIKSLKVYQNGGGGVQASVGVNIPGASAQASLSLGGGSNPAQASSTAPPSGDQNFPPQSSNAPQPSSTPTPDGGLYGGNTGQFDNGQYHGEGGSQNDQSQSSSAAPADNSSYGDNGGQPQSSSAPQPISTAAPDGGLYNGNGGQNFQSSAPQPSSTAAPDSGLYDGNSGKFDNGQYHGEGASQPTNNQWKLRRESYKFDQ